MRKDQITVLKGRTDLLRKINKRRSYFNYDIKNLSFFCDKFVLIQFFVKDMKTKYGDDRYLIIATEIDQEEAKKLFDSSINGNTNDENEEGNDLKLGNTYKIFSSSSRINSSLSALEEADENCFPLLVKIVKKTLFSKDKKTNKLKEITYFELDT